MSDGVMIAYLPAGDTSWCKQDLPHMTLVYAGAVDALAPATFNEMAKDAITAGRLTGPFPLDVTGVEVFGEDAEKVDVLTLYPTPNLLTARALVEKWNGSSYKDFAPHATVGPEGSADIVPSKLYFDRVMVGWGYRRLVFPLAY